MRILILEDEQYRIDSFKENFIGCTLDITKSPEEAIEWLTENTYDFIFLDHDLSEIDYENFHNSIMGESGTGYDVSRFLGNNVNLNKDVPVVIHSINPAGSNRMFESMRNRKNINKIPFNVLWTRLQINLTKI